MFKGILKLANFHFKLFFPWITMSESNSIEQILKSIEKNIENIIAKYPRNDQQQMPRLVAVSKTKPVEKIIEAYKAGQKHFGENYPQELCSKAHNPKILEECPEIQWHFIGHLQTNKVSKLVDIPNLFTIQTIDSEKLAERINACVEENTRYKDRKLRVFVQINTSGEENKSGISPSEAVNLTKFIIEKCPKLEFAGVMTIGRFGHDASAGPNPDYIALLNVQKQISQEMNLSRKNIEVSMGMSDDYEHALELGSTIVRIGSLIFGEREKKALVTNTGKTEETPEVQTTTQ